MKATELISHLATMIDVHGNLELSDDFSIKKNKYESITIIANEKAE